MKGNQYVHLQILIRGCHPQDFVHLVSVICVTSENSVQATLRLSSGQVSEMTFWEHPTCHCMTMINEIASLIGTRVPSLNLCIAWTYPFGKANIIGPSSPQTQWGDLPAIPTYTNDKAP